MHEPVCWAARLVSVPGQLREHLALLPALTLALQTKGPFACRQQCASSSTCNACSSSSVTTSQEEQPGERG